MFTLWQFGEFLLYSSVDRRLLLVGEWRNGEIDLKLSSDLCFLSTIKTDRNSVCSNDEGGQSNDESHDY